MAVNFLSWFFCLFLALALPSAVRATRHTWLQAPTENFFEFQTLDHFDRTVYGYWKQRYFVNDAYRRPGSPVFLVLGGQESFNPVWLLEGAVVDYARNYGAILVMLEHRYYGKSRPVGNLEVHNLRHLSSRQALADIATFIQELPYAVNVTKDTKVVLFGAGYAGALATWFRSKYPYMVTGAVAFGPPLVATDNFADYLVNVAAALDTIGTSCTAEIKNASGTMFEWWGQPEKRNVLQNIFRLCDKIDHDVVIDLASFFYATATTFAKAVEFNHVNRTIEGKPDGEFTMKDACDVMTSGAWGSSVERYAKVTSLILDQYRLPCLTARFARMVGDLNQTSWDSYSAEGGRQKLYQTCTEFGWNPNSMSTKQPFGEYLMFPLNFTFDQCIGAFGQELYSVIEVESNCEETNRFYGGLDLSVSNVVIVNGGIDPWRTVSAIMPLKNSPVAEIILIPGTAHLASWYPPSPRDPPQLYQARTRINMIISTWL